MKRLYPLAAALILAGSVTDGGSGAPVKIELPPETESFRYAPGAEIANGQCLTCHSVEYVATQPPMPRTFWASAVKKMQDKYGAPVPPEQVETLVDYLTDYYGVNTNKSRVLSPNPAATSNVASSNDGSALAQKYGCLGCHNVSVKIVGPAYREIAAKYNDDQLARSKIAEQIRHGGSGKWGPVIMPPFPQVNDAETKVISDWILGQK